MSIAVIGWGSLIWSERTLKVENGSWRNDGPLLPIEFSRISTDNRLTLVIDPDFGKVRTYWKLSLMNDLVQACENLRVREDTPDMNDIGYLDLSSDQFRIREPNQFLIPELKAWGNSKGVDALIWTELEPKFIEKTGNEFKLEYIKTFIDSLTREEWARAEEYIRMAPEQTSTNLRSKIYSLFS